MDEKVMEARKIVKHYMWWSMGAGLIPVPIWDLVAVGGVQVKMLSELSKVYNVEFSENGGKAITGAVLGTLVPFSLANGGVGRIVKSVPIVGSLIGMITEPLFAGASTYALGVVFSEHLESGGTFLSFDPSKAKERLKKAYEEGKVQVKKATGRAGTEVVVPA
jgi:uncharacterized protein (DUF697 family)